MISGVKDMILRCIARMRGGQCATCDNRACPAGQWQRAFAAPPEQRSGRAELFAGLRGLIEALAPSRAPACFRRQVEDAIERLIGQGEVSADGVAAVLNLSRPTLYRRLKAEGTTFQDLLEAKRRQLAIRMLGVERSSVKAAAYRLGFSDPAAFSRAFKRWTGHSPSAFQTAT
jgi:AraC-like DNA-binding protein